MSSPAKKALIKMSKSSFIKEHKHLAKVLKTGKGLKEEYKKQSKELKEHA